MPRFLSRFRACFHLLPLLGALALSGCSNPKDEFIGARVLDACNQTWPVCGSIAGCLIGSQSYVEGGMPGKQQVVVQLSEPSVVRVRVFVEEISSQGNQTTIDFFEDGCRSRVQETVTGKQFADEARQMGEFTRAADLTGIGDHLIEFTSDAQAHYLLQVEVTPKQDAQ
jgi:hypothetical protein